MSSLSNVETINGTTLSPFEDWHEPGYFTVSGPVSEDDILKMAKQIQRQRFPKTGEKLAKTSHAMDYIQSEIGSLRQMQYAVLYLNNQNEVIAFETLFKGTHTSCNVFKREIFKRAYELGATNLISAINRPSGLVEPSEIDIKTHQSLKSAADMLEFSLLDCIIVSSTRTYSMANNGKI